MRCSGNNPRYFGVAAVGIRYGLGLPSGLRLMRYYFHLRIGQKLSPDDTGLELPDLETAYLEAFEAAQAMWGELLAERSDPLARSFEIADEQGQLLLTLPFVEVLDRARKPRPLSDRASGEKWRSTEQLLAVSLREQIETARKMRASLREQIGAAREALEATRQMLERTTGLLDRVRRTRSG